MLHISSFIFLTEWEKACTDLWWGLPSVPLHNPCLSISSFDIIFQIYEGLYLDASRSAVAARANERYMTRDCLPSSKYESCFPYLYSVRYPTLCYILQNLWLSSFKYEIFSMFLRLFVHRCGHDHHINSIYRYICWPKNCSQYCSTLHLPSWSKFLNNHLGTHAVVHD